MIWRGDLLRVFAQLTPEQHDDAAEAMGFVRKASTEMPHCEPLDDCRICRGSGEENGLRCECTLVCQCGERRPDGIAYCHHPGCERTGCDACGEIEWCCSPYDEADGDYFCSEHRY